jgi:hypothetical protein
MIGTGSENGGLRGEQISYRAQTVFQGRGVRPGERAMACDKRWIQTAYTSVGGGGVDKREPDC